MRALRGSNSIFSESAMRPLSSRAREVPRGGGGSGTGAGAGVSVGGGRTLGRGGGCGCGSVSSDFYHYVEA